MDLREFPINDTGKTGLVMLEMLKRRKKTGKAEPLKSLHVSKEAMSFKIWGKKKGEDSRLKECDKRFGIIALGNLVSIQMEMSQRMTKLYEAPGSSVV